METRTRKRIRDDSSLDEPVAKRPRWTLRPCSDQDVPVIYSKSDFVEDEVQELLDVIDQEDSEVCRVRIITETTDATKGPEQDGTEITASDNGQDLVVLSLSHREALDLLAALNAALQTEHQTENKTVSNTLGYVMTSTRNGNIHIDYLDVFAENRGRGIASDVVQQIRQEAGPDKTVTACARKDAVGFWQKARGFTSNPSKPCWFAGKGKVGRR